jgi:hypothetical protein
MHSAALSLLLTTGAAAKPGLASLLRQVDEMPGEPEADHPSRHAQGQLQQFRFVKRTSSRRGSGAFAT